MIGSFNKFFKIYRPKTTLVNGQTQEGLDFLFKVKGRLSTTSKSRVESIGRDAHRITHRFSTRPIDIHINDIVVGNNQRIRIEAVSFTSTGRRIECLGESIK